MAFTIANFDSSVLKYKLFEDSDVNNVLREDITQGVAGKLYGIDFDNNRGQAAYLKITLTQSGVAIGTTSPEIMFYVASTSGEARYWIPEGIAFTELSFWAVQLARDDNSAALSGGSASKVRLITS